MIATSHKDQILARLNGGLIVSVQAEKTEPLGKTEMIVALAQTVVNAGCHGLRLAGAEHIEVIKLACPDIPIIGITKPDVMPKYPEQEVYITPTLKDALSVAQAGADIIAMDATMRPRPNGESLDTIIAGLRDAYPDIILMADIATEDEGLEAEALGFDLIGTTLSGYTENTINTASQSQPDWTLLEGLVQECTIPIILEGRVASPIEVVEAFAQDAFAVVVGSAITRPAWITKQFLSSIPKI